jgi:glucokinase
VIGAVDIEGIKIGHGELAKTCRLAYYPRLSELTAKDTCDLPQHGNELAQQEVTRESHYFGLGLANLVRLFTPNAIMPDGSVMKSATLSLNGIRRIIRESCHFVSAEATEFSLVSLGHDSNLTGAPRVWHFRFGQSPGGCVAH